MTSCDIAALQYIFTTASSGPLGSRTCGPRVCGERRPRHHRRRCVSLRLSLVLEGGRHGLLVDALANICTNAFRRDSRFARGG